jgi:hypothetical protein
LHTHAGPRADTEHERSKGRFRAGSGRADSGADTRIATVRAAHDGNRGLRRGQHPARLAPEFALAPSVELSHLVERQVINVGIHLDPPKLVKGTPSPEGTTMVVFLANDGMHVGHRPNGPTEPTWDALLTWDANTMAELERHAAQFVAEHPPVEGEQHHKAVFMADPEMPVGRLIEAMIAASGRDCRYQDVWGTKLGDRKRCHIAQRILEAGRAPTTGP